MRPLLKHVLLLGAAAVASLLVAAQLVRSGGTLLAQAPGAGKRRRETRAWRWYWGLRLAGALLVIAAGGFLFAASGIMPLKASSGHWDITSWLLNFAMERSVTTHALLIDAPPLDDEALVLKGAGHYEIGCRPCHGSPDLAQQPRIAEWMTPHPPNLSQQVPNWDAHELFYIVKHGVKFTGMPAWPAQTRDDEVWAMVAFLQRLPALSGDEYKRLVSGGESAGNAVIDDLAGPQVPVAVRDSCGRCHGVEGAGRGTGAFPKLAGQNPEYFIASMDAYARGRRSSGIMEPIAVALSREAVTELARYYAGAGSKSAGRQPLGAELITDDGRPQSVTGASDGRASIAPSSMDTARIAAAEAAVKLVSPGTTAVKSVAATRQSGSALERGREIALNGIPEQRVPACSECHGPGAIRRNPHYPVLAGQYADYLVLQLTLFQNQARGGTAYAHLMRRVAPGLTAEQMRDVALFYESLGK
jgi:cytochrome c553